MNTRLQFYPISFVLKFLLLIAIALFPTYNNSLRKPFHSFEFIVLIILISIFIFIIIKELILDSHYLKYITQNTLLAFAIWELVKFIQSSQRRNMLSAISKNQETGISMMPWIIITKFKRENF